MRVGRISIGNGPVRINSWNVPHLVTRNEVRAVSELSPNLIKN